MKLEMPGRGRVHFCWNKDFRNFSIWDAREMSRWPDGTDGSPVGILSLPVTTWHYRRGTLNRTGITKVESFLINAPDGIQFQRHLSTSVALAGLAAVGRLRNSGRAWQQKIHFNAEQFFRSLLELFVQAQKSTEARLSKPSSKCRLLHEWRSRSKRMPK